MARKFQWPYTTRHNQHLSNPLSFCELLSNWLLCSRINFCLDGATNHSLTTRWSMGNVLMKSGDFNLRESNLGFHCKFLVLIHSAIDGCIRSGTCIRGGVDKNQEFIMESQVRLPEIKISRFHHVSLNLFSCLWSTDYTRTPLIAKQYQSGPLTSSLMAKWSMGAVSLVVDEWFVAIPEHLLNYSRSLIAIPDHPQVARCHSLRSHTHTHTHTHTQDLPWLHEHIFIYIYW